MNSVLDVLRVSLLAVSHLLTLARSSFSLRSVFSMLLLAKDISAYHQRTFEVVNVITKQR